MTTLEQYGIYACIAIIWWFLGYAYAKWGTNYIRKFRKPNPKVWKKDGKNVYILR